MNGKLKSRSSIPYREKIFLFCRALRWLQGQLSFPFFGYRVCCTGVKCLGHEVDHLLHGVAKVKNVWSCTSSTQCAIVTCKAINTLLTLHKFVSFEIWIPDMSYYEVFRLVTLCSLGDAYWCFYPHAGDSRLQYHWLQTDLSYSEFKLRSTLKLLHWTAW
jgi:hypothetical protein